MSTLTESEWANDPDGLPEPQERATGAIAELKGAIEGLYEVLKLLETSER